MTNLMDLSLALVTLVTPHYFNGIARSGYFSRQFRRFCSDYGMPITIIAATGLAYWGRFDPYVAIRYATSQLTDKIDQICFGVIDDPSNYVKIPPTRQWQGMARPLLAA